MTITYFIKRVLGAKLTYLQFPKVAKLHNLMYIAKNVGAGTNMNGGIIAKNVEAGINMEGGIIANMEAGINEGGLFRERYKCLGD